MTTETNTPVPPSIAERFAAQTKAVALLLVNVGTMLVSVTDGAKAIAAEVVAVRMSIEREVTSKKTGKTVTVPDLDGRSPAYREWYKDVFGALIEEHIPETYRGTIRTSVQNHVQALVKTESTPAQRAHLGIAATNKSEKQFAKRTAAKAQTTTDRATDERFDVDSLTDYVKDETTSIVDAAQSIAAMSETLARRTLATVETMSKSDRKNAEKLISQAMQHLLTAGGAIKTADSSVLVTA